mmetsp:Transcript_123309/g.356325  ORF Transcript_123309/g.356325 Transcript_123309/m.356325 type:complete len:217 (+) Transcript_123309:47-697(+)
MHSMALVSLEKEKPPLRIKIVGATGLRKADLGIKSTSDPFCVIELSGKSWRSPVVKNSLDPVWNFEFETREYNLGDRMFLSVYDHDRMSADDFLGSCNLSCAEWGYPGGLTTDVRLSDQRRKCCVATVRVDIGPLQRYQETAAKAVRSEAATHASETSPCVEQESTQVWKEDDGQSPTNDKQEYEVLAANERIAQQCQEVSNDGTCGSCLCSTARV